MRFTRNELRMAVAVGLGLTLCAAAGLSMRRGEYHEHGHCHGIPEVAGAVRSTLSNFYHEHARFPTAKELATPGVVMNDVLPRNPYNGSNEMRMAGSLIEARARTAYGGAGWAYYVDNTPGHETATFWCNSAVTTWASDGRGGFFTPNNL